LLIFVLCLNVKAIALETAICRNPSTYNFTEDRKNLTNPQQTNTKYVMFLRKYKKNIFLFVDITF